MNKIYIEISKLTDKFRTMCYGLTQNEHDIENAVQELMLYFLSMNSETYEYKHLENKPENIDVAQWEKLEQIDVALENLHWYDRELFKLYYYEGNTLDSLAAKTNISRNSLFTTIDKVREILKKELVDE